MDVGFKTDKGISRFNNEDACYVMVDKGVFVVADGVGGSSSGEIASRTATRFITQYVEDNPIDLKLSLIHISCSEHLLKYRRWGLE